MVTATAKKLSSNTVSSAVAQIEPGYTQALRRLHDYYLLSDRFSHSIRTHLSVAMGVVDDLLSGLHLTSDDFSDAAQALREILRTLESLREMANPPRPAFVRSSLPAILLELKNSSLLPAVELVISADCQGALSNLRIDPTLFARALQALLHYGAARQKRFARTRTSNPLLILRHQQALQASHCPDDCWELSLSFEQHDAPDANILKEASCWRDLAQADHSPESLKLLFAETVMEYHGAETYFRYDLKGSLSFISCFHTPARKSLKDKAA